MTPTTIPVTSPLLMSCLPGVGVGVDVSEMVADAVAVGVGAMEGEHDV